MDNSSCLNVNDVYLYPFFTSEFLKETAIGYPGVLASRLAYFKDELLQDKLLATYAREGWVEELSEGKSLKSGAQEQLPLAVLGSELFLRVISKCIKNQSFMELTSADFLGLLQDFSKSYLDESHDKSFDESLSESLDIDTFTKKLIDDFVSLYHLDIIKAQDYAINLFEKLCYNIKIKESFAHFFKIVAPLLTLSGKLFCANFKVATLALMANEAERSFWKKYAQNYSKASLLAAIFLDEAWSKVLGTTQKGEVSSLDAVFKARIKNPDIIAMVGDMHIKDGVIANLPLEDGDFMLLEEGVNRIISMQDATKAAQELRLVSIAPFKEHLLLTEQFTIALSSSCDETLKDYFFNTQLQNSELLFVSNFKVFTKVLNMLTQSYGQKGKLLLAKDEQVLFFIGSALVTNKEVYLFNKAFNVSERFGIDKFLNEVEISPQGLKGNSNKELGNNITLYMADNKIAPDFLVPVNENKLEFAKKIIAFLAHIPCKIKALNEQSAV